MAGFLTFKLTTLCLLATIASSAHVRAADRAFPLILPVNKNHAQIPNGQGLAAFLGNWDDMDRLANIRITPNAMISTSQTKESPIRVLTEADNYVLLLKYVTTRMPPPWDREWSTFVILTFQGDHGERLGYYACNDSRMDDSKAPFLWPLDRIIDVFKTSTCFTKSGPDADDPLRPIWGRWTYKRPTP